MMINPVPSEFLMAKKIHVFTIISILFKCVQDSQWSISNNKGYLSFCYWVCGDFRTPNLIVFLMSGKLDAFNKSI